MIFKCFRKLNLFLIIMIFFVYKIKIISNNKKIFVTIRVEGNCNEYIFIMNKKYLSDKTFH